MKFKWKIVLLCVLIYLFSISLLAVLVSEQIYSDSINTEIERSLDEESSLHSSITLYLLGSIKEKTESINLEDYALRLNDMLKGDRLFLEFYTKDLELLSSSCPFKIEQANNYLEAACSKGRNYILIWNAGRHYLLINDVLEMDGQFMPFTYIKDINWVDQSRTEHYLLFIRSGFTGLLLIVLLAYILSKLLLKPLEQLGLSARRITHGQYAERVPLESNDEIGNLALQFNTMAAAVEEHVQELQREDEHKQRFIDNLSHEMRTPLTAIIGYAETLKKIKYDEITFFTGLNYIHNEGLRLQRLFSSLMNLSLLRETKLELEKVAGEILLRDALQMMEPLAASRDIKLLSACDNITEFTVNRDLMKDVFGNLMENAIRASAPHSQIIVGCATEENSKYIFVRDEGCGISPDELQKISEPFYRVDKSRSRTEGGLGLGLAICQGIVEKHGANLQINSTVGQGTEVKIIWPPEKAAASIVI